MKKDEIKIPDLSRRYDHSTDDVRRRIEERKKSFENKGKSQGKNQGKNQRKKKTSPPKTTVRVSIKGDTFSLEEMPDKAQEEKKPEKNRKTQDRPESSIRTAGQTKSRARTIPKKTSSGRPSYKKNKKSRGSGLTPADLLGFLPVFLLVFFCIVAAVFLMSKHDQNKKTAMEENGNLTITCPQLSEAADAFLLYYEGEAVLIDTGVKEDGKNIVAFLKENKINRLKAIILTHYDKDHIGGAAEIINNISVDRCYMSCSSEDSEEYEDLMKALEKKNVEQIIVTTKCSFSQLGGEITIYPPLEESYAKDNDNNFSLITELSFRNNNLLFAGDARNLRMTEFFEKQYDGTDYDLVKIPHHGRDENTTQSILEHFTPQFAVITSDAKEKEDNGALELMKNAGVQTLLTRKGTVLIKANYNGITVTQP